MAAPAANPPLSPEDANSLDGIRDRSQGPQDTNHASSKKPMSEPTFEDNNKGFKLPNPDLFEVEDKAQGPRPQYQAASQDPGRSG